MSSASKSIHSIPAIRFHRPIFGERWKTIEYSNSSPTPEDVCQVMFASFLGRLVGDIARPVGFLEAGNGGGQCLDHFHHRYRSLVSVAVWHYERI